MEQPVETIRSADSRTLARHPSDRWIGGIAAGLAHRWGVDPALVRVVFLLAAMMSGTGLIAYGLGWLFLPDSRTGTSAARDLTRGRPGVAVPLGLALVLVGLTRPLLWIEPWPWGYSYVGGSYGVAGLVTGWLVLLLALGTVAVVVLARRASRLRVSGDGGGSPSVDAAPFAGVAPFGAVPFGAAPGDRPAWYASGPDDGGAPGAFGIGAVPGGPTAGEATGTATGTIPYPTAGAGPDPELAALAAARRLIPPRSRRVRAPGPGRRLSSAIGAFALLGPALVLAVNSQWITAGALLIACGAALAALALGIVISGIRGRRGGWMTGLAVVLAPLLAVAFAAATLVPRAVLVDLPITATQQVQRDGTGYTFAGSVNLAPEGDTEVVVGFGSLALDVAPTDALRIEVEGGAVYVGGWDFEGWEVGDSGNHTPASWYRDPVEGSVHFNQEVRGRIVLLSPAAVEDGPETTVRVTMGAGNLWIQKRGEN